jgi:hypothetical protein
MRLYAEPQRNLRNVDFRDESGASIYRAKSHYRLLALSTTDVSRVNLDSDGQEQLQEIGGIKWAYTFKGDELRVRGLTVNVKTYFSTHGLWKPYAVSTFLLYQINC